MFYIIFYFNCLYFLLGREISRFVLGEFFLEKYCLVFFYFGFNIFNILFVLIVKNLNDRKIVKVFKLGRIVFFRDVYFRCLVDF